MAFDAKLENKAKASQAALKKQEYIISTYEKHKEEFNARLDDMIGIIKINSGK